MTLYEVTFREDRGGDAQAPVRQVNFREFKAFLWVGGVVLGRATINEYSCLRTLEHVEIEGDRTRIPLSVLVGACRERWPGIEISDRLVKVEKIFDEDEVEVKIWPLVTKRTIQSDFNEIRGNPLIREIVEAAKALSDDGLEEIVDQGLNLGYETVGVNTYKLKKLVDALKGLRLR